MNQNHIDASPSEKFLEVLDYNLDPLVWNLAKLKSLALELNVPRPRTLAWGIMLQTLPLPHDGLLQILQTHRNYYNSLKAKLFMDPRAVADDDPLSQNVESVWNQHFCDNELKAVILQDVVRTFPDELYFREQEVQDLMVRVLFYWSREHSHVGYRQGMHEVLAPLLHELYCDRNYAPAHICDVLKDYLDEDYIEHDSYMLLNVVMRGLERFYTTGDVVPSPSGRMPAAATTHNPNEVVRYLEKIREDYLIPLDPELATHLATCNISLELFGIRWLRLLFGREFPRSETAQLWSFIFREGPSLSELHYVVVAMLITMRAELLEPETGLVLNNLMRPRRLSVRHVTSLALHLASPLAYRAPPPPAKLPPVHDPWALEQRGYTTPATGRRASLDSAGSVGVAEGDDVARSLATLALLRARLPPAAAALAAALPRPPPPTLAPAVQQILQLASLLQCRNHALIDVETALEAAEAQTTDNLGKRQIVPVTLSGGKRFNTKPVRTVKSAAKEVQLTTFHQAEFVASDSDYPCLDPLRLRTD